MKAFLCVFAAGAGALLLHSQTPSAIPLNERVMVVYNAGGEGSQKVAKYYMEKRDIPKANLCKIDTGVEAIEEASRLEPDLKKPLRACLEKLGKQQILYIVFSFQTPYNANLNGHQVSIDQVAADVWDEYAGPGVVGRDRGDQPYFGRAQSQGNAYEPFVPFAKYREQANAKTIYSVWRLDGATVAAAESLVDKALYAESHGLHGNGYFDIKSPIQTTAPDTGYGAGEWDIYQSSQMTKRAGFEITLDDKETEFGTAPSLLKCDNAALYAGWYSLAHYNDAFTWVPGAIGFHLDSASATNPRSGPSWVAGALQRGITVTSGSVTEPYLEGLVHPDQIFLSLFQGANVGDAVLRGTRWLKWMIVNLGDPLYRPFPKGAGIYGLATRGETLFAIAQTTVVGEGKVRAQFALAGKIEQPTPVTFRATYPDLVVLPTNVTLPPTANGGQFEIGVKAPPEALNLVVTISAGTETVSNTINLFPILSGLTLGETSIKAGGNTTATVTLLVPAKELGYTIRLSSSQPAAVTVPSEVKVAAGAKQASFAIGTKAVAGEVTAIITAQFDGAAKTAQVKVTP